ncbi:uncharacterized protein EV422DRAFT_545915 [Fimicolochytrium jonesii]|uniref:uncharacterized protein n=1 Tax=Fimicolochytrium jonesii TaxID=1396493 RepID=UPI0022FDCB1B|nr:uncharacterized protein EV422DRAFT_545915 [Fimicolochytrium jonesii]KAI8816411.1 hypothetical protein EV422DRAFT_545915 [Fimicolochytrium jonesii]
MSPRLFRQPRLAARAGLTRHHLSPKATNICTAPLKPRPSSVLFPTSPKLSPPSPHILKTPPQRRTLTLSSTTSTSAPHGHGSGDFTVHPTDTLPSIPPRRPDTIITGPELEMGYPRPHLDTLSSPGYAYTPYAVPSRPRHDVIEERRDMDSDGVPTPPVDDSGPPPYPWLKRRVATISVRVEREEGVVEEEVRLRDELGGLLKLG